MPLLTRVAAFAPLSAATLNAWADEIERVTRGLFSDNTLTSRPRFKVERTFGSTLSVATNTDIVVPFQAQISDPLNMWDPAAPTRIDIPAEAPGDWLLFGQLRWVGAATGSRATKILRNGTNPLSGNPSIASSKLPSQSDGEGSTLQIAALARLGAGDAIYMNAWHSQGANTTVASDYGGTYLAGVWLGP